MKKLIKHYPMTDRLIVRGGYTLKVDLYSGRDSNATSNTIVAMEKRYYCEIIAFLLRRYYRIQFVFPSDFDNIFFMILDGNYSATVAISLES